MSAAYTFLPWLRSGVANTITSPDGANTGSARTTIHIDLTLTGQPVGGGAPLVRDVAQDVTLYGPGDIVGIDSRAVIRTEPRNWITNFESNYLAAIEFYDEDFCWRYTPAAPGTPDGAGGPNLRLRPWIALVVLEESEFSEGQNLAGRPLPYISVADTSVFPAAGDLWAWAHVHFNQSLNSDPTQVISKDMGAVLTSAQAVTANADAAYSRLMCPRRLDPNTVYHAFVIPVFETGRLAGLGHPPDGAPLATASAWAAYAGQLEPTYFPIYYRWYFRTGTVGDFEYLVGLLRPQPVDPRVGVRDMDVQYPGSGVPGILDPGLGGVLRLGGALRVPDVDLTAEQLSERQKYDQWDQQPPQTYPHPFEQHLAQFINLADDYAGADAASANANTGLSDDPDPLITPPLYGRWHALTQRLLVDRNGQAEPNTTNWVHRLNLDPLYRVPAGLGAQVIEKNAEAYMNAAWDQIGDVLAANARIRRLHLAAAVSSQWYINHLQPLSAVAAERAYTLTAPVARRVLVAGRTIAYSQSGSHLASAMTSTALRRVVRPGSRLMNALPFDATVTRTNLLARVNTGVVSAAPPKTVPSGVTTIDTAGPALASAAGIPQWVLDLLQRFSSLPLAVLGAAVVVALLLALLLPVVGLVLGGAVLVGAVIAYVLLKRANGIGVVSAALNPTSQTPAAVDALPRSPDFSLSEPGSNVVPTAGAVDSLVASRFKEGLKDSFNLLQTSATVGAQVPRASIDLTALTGALVSAVNPTVTILQRGFAAISIPAWASGQLSGPYEEVMAYPRIDLPMYQPLKDLSIELFLPNINLIAPNSLTLIETNRKFLEAYMVGLNHEFARKLLWREYPTDQRGSYFRQFWDPAPYFDAANLDPAALREKLYDIPPLHTWPLSSQLGQHPNPPQSGAPAEDLVLVIRGELLKRYPTAVIYVHRAQWQTKSDGSIDPTKPRQLVTLTAAEEPSPPTTKVRTPLYEAKADPDIYFFGFDLTAAQARGGPGTNPNDDPGWFFVLKERPGEPRFGLELARDGDLETFDELTWDDALPGSGSGPLLPADALASVVLATAQGDANQQQQHAEDVQVSGASMSSARWAYLLFRAPVMVAVHAAQMLGSGAA
jgi:hypothetical protein